MKITRTLRLIIIIAAIVLIQACGGSKTPPPAPRFEPAPPSASIKVATGYRECKPVEIDEGLSSHGVWRAPGYYEVSAAHGYRALNFAINSAGQHARSQLSTAFKTAASGLFTEAASHGFEFSVETTAGIDNLFSNAIHNAPIICAIASEENGRYRVMVVVETRVNPNEVDRILTGTVSNNTGSGVTRATGNNTANRVGASGQNLLDRFTDELQKLRNRQMS
jgi:hypothetical protein